MLTVGNSLTQPHYVPGPSGPPPGLSGWHLLRSRNFGLLWAGQSVSQIGDSVNKVALLWFVYTLTGSAQKMAVVGLLQTIPPLVLGPVIGVYLDRLPKKFVMITVDLIQALLILAIPILHGLGLLTLERLYLLVFLVAVLGAVFGPALASAVPLIVSRSHLTAANALLQGTANIGGLVGPALGGVGISLIGAQNVLYIDAACNLLSALCLMLVRVQEVVGTVGREGSTGTVFGDFLAGIRFVRQDLVFELMLTTVLYTAAASAFVFLLPVYAKEWLHVGPVGLGLLWSGIGAGMLASSVWLVWRKEQSLAIRFQLVSRAMAVGSLSVCAMIVFQQPVIATLLVIIVGGSKGLFMPIVWAVLQDATPANLRGRMFTTFSLGGMASAMAGIAAVGWAADSLGTSVALAGIAAALLATAVLAAVAGRGDRKNAGAEVAVAPPQRPGARGEHTMRTQTISSGNLFFAVVLLSAVGLYGCAQDDGYGAKPVRYGSGSPVYPRPYYREYGPWDLPSTSSYPGPPTWYGCPQGAAACYPD